LNVEGSNDGSLVKRNYRV